MHLHVLSPLATAGLVLTLSTLTTASLESTLYNLPSCKSEYLGTTRANGVVDFGADNGWSCTNMTDPYSGEDHTPASYSTKSLKIPNLPKGCALRLYGNKFGCGEVDIVETCTEKSKKRVEITGGKTVWRYDLKCGS